MCSIQLNTYNASKSPQQQRTAVSQYGLCDAPDLAPLSQFTFIPHSACDMLKKAIKRIHRFNEFSKLIFTPGDQLTRSMRGSRKDWDPNG